eukprot:TRINITY_DN1987_c0_g1_i2.p1 TRINITY_DN1987_c0_g1~~TRINITY_DN1987_c0_g1_i2.p1  ORF type:complete len:416 (+),score=104.82 TRINITY_DN1987_c0_g1_i2:78-1250(+)
MWWGTPQHVHNRRAEAAEAEKISAKVPSLGSTPMDLDVKGTASKELLALQLSGGFQSLLADQECCDLQFSACGEVIAAHAVVLAAGSTNFRSFLRKNPLPRWNMAPESDVDQGQMEELLTCVAQPTAPVATESSAPAESPPSNDAAGAGGEPGPAPKAEDVSTASTADTSTPATTPSAGSSSVASAADEAAPLRIEVNGICSAEAFRILIDYLYVACTGANWQYAPADGNAADQVNKDVLRLARHFGLSQLHEHAARWLAKGLTTANVVERLVTCEEFGLGLLREKIGERLTLNPTELMTVCSSPEITKHPKILQDLLVQVASLRDRPTPERNEEKRDNKREEKEKEKPEKAEKEKPEKSEKEKREGQKREEKPAQSEKPAAKRAKKAGS